MLIHVAAALACGGLFCDAQPPMPLPIDQTGERIVFALHDDPDFPAVDMHVQISYQGEAANFAWLVPVPEVPSLYLSTDELFAALERATAPRFQLQTVQEDGCPPPPDDTDLDAEYAGMADTDSDGGGPVIVHARDTIGPYDTVVLRGDSGDAIVAWLRDNAYLVPESIAPHLDPYVSANSWFVALRLSKDKDVGDLAPLAMRYAGREPTIPLALTGVAATPDMRIIPWILANSRAVPENYLHVRLNEAAFDWLNRGTNYSAVVTAAADAAGGQAFATDFAGPISLRSALMWSGRFDVAALRTAPNLSCMLASLSQQGFPRGPALDQTLERFFPGAAAILAAGPSGDMCFPWPDTGLADTDAPVPTDPAFDPNPLVDALFVTFIEPLGRAQELLDGASYATRLTSSASPEEMTVDPRFVLNPSLDDVSNVHTATRELDCDGDFVGRLVLSDGQVIAIPSGAWLQNHGYADQDAWFQALRDEPVVAVEQTGRSGAPTVVIDRSETIRRTIDAMNNEVGLDRALNLDGCGCTHGAQPAAAWGVVLGLLAARRRR